MDTYLITLFLALLAFAIGLGEGILWQRAMDERHIRNLEGQRNDAHEEMVQQEWCCERMTELEARIRELDRLLAEIELDEDDEPPSSIVYVYRRTPTADEIAHALALEQWLEDEAMLKGAGSPQ